MVGGPSVALLDEPSTGIDPISRRKMWDFVAETTAHSQRSVLLTTHSMEEAEALCPRIAIMDKSKLRCLGSVQHLKTVHGDNCGYTLFVKLEEGAGVSRMDSLKDLILN